MEDLEYISKCLCHPINSFYEINEDGWYFLSKFKLSEEFIEKYQDKVNWNNVSQFQSLSEKFMEKHFDKLNSKLISEYQVLSESFIEQHKNDLDWNNISVNQILSEPFMEKNHYLVNFYYISKFQALSESFIERYSFKLDWFYIAKYQKLSEQFIERNLRFLDFFDVLTYQKLSESFIEKHLDLISNSGFNKAHCLKYQKLSEQFIEKHLNNINCSQVEYYQKLSDEFIKAHNLNIDKDNLWQYKDAKLKKQELIKTGKYECHEDYFIAYKAIRKDRYSLFNFQYQYLPGETYESTCDCTANENSFGLNVGTYKFAKLYFNYRKGIIVKCKISYEDIGRIVHDGDKVRCFKITILE